MEKPDQEELIKALEKVAGLLGCNPMSRGQSENLINHILYDLCWSGTDAKYGWEQFEKEMITERELCRLFLEHAQTKIARFNSVNEQDLVGVYQEKIFKLTEKALLGRSAVVNSVDTILSWDKNA